MNGLGRRLFNLVLVTMMVLPSLAPLSATAATPTTTVIKTAITTPAIFKNSPKTGYAVPDHIIVRMKDNANVAKMLPGTLGITSGDVKQTRGVTTVKVPKGKTAATLASELSRRSDVEYASPDYVRQVEAYTATPNDTAYLDTGTYSFDSISYANGKSWWLRSSGADMSSLWGALGATTYGPRATGAGIKVAVIDTGFYMTHPDRGTNIVAGKDEFQSYTNGIYVTDNDVTPVSSSAPKNDVSTAAHGTAVAGQIAAATNNGVGVAGISYDTTVMVYKVQGIWTTGDPTNGYPAGSAIMLDSAIINAIRDAADAGADIINMSLGGPSYSTAMQAAINEAHNAHGVLICAASGNDGTLNNVNYPAANSNVIAVGSYELAAGTVKIRSSFTDYGVGADVVGAGVNNGQLDVLAPGNGIWGLCDPANSASGFAGYRWWSGTSMASPSFAGMAALLWRFIPNLTADEMAGYMLSNSAAAGAGQPNTNYGWGYVNPVNTYSKMKTDFAYLMAPVLTASALTKNTSVPLSWTAVNGRSVSYDVTVDGGVVASGLSGLSTMLTLAEGTHNIKVTPKSGYNWTNDAFGSSQIIVDTTTPALSTPTVTAPTSTTIADNNISWNSVPYATFYEYQLNGGTVTSMGNVTSKTFTLVKGSNTLTIRSRNSTAASNWTSKTIIFTPSVLAAPTNPLNVSTSINSAGVFWAPIPYAVSYDYQIDTGTILNTASTSVNLTSLPKGVTTIKVRSRSRSDDVSIWNTTTVTFTPPVPLMPSIISINPLEPIENNVTISWNMVPFAVSYDYQVKNSIGTVIAASVGNTASTGVVITTMVVGANTIQIRSRSAYTDVSAWTDISIVYAVPVVYTITNPLVAPSIVYGSSAVLSANIRGSDGSTPAVPVLIQSSTNQTTWSNVATINSTVGGVIRYTVKPSRITYYRITYSGTNGQIVSKSGRAGVKAYLTTPSSVSHHSHSSFTVSGYLKPRHTSGNHNVKIKAYWRDSHGKYVLKKTITLKNYNYSSYTKYSGSVSLPYNGYWHLYTYYTGTSTFDANTSGYKLVHIN